MKKFYILLSVLFILSIMACASTTPAPEKEAEKKTPVGVVSTVKPTPVKFSSGHYIAGTDFTAGTWTLTAQMGDGVVTSSNMFDGGLNATMGISEGAYIKEFKNVKLPSGTRLDISDVTISMVWVR